MHTLKQSIASNLTISNLKDVILTSRAMSLGKEFSKFHYALLLKEGA